MLQRFKKRMADVGISKRRYYAIFFLLLVIPLLVVFLLVQSVYISRLKDNYADNVVRMSTNLKNDLDYEFKLMETTARAILGDKELSFTLSPSQPVDIWKLQERLAEYRGRSSFVDEIYFFSTNNDYVFSDISSYTYENLLSRIQLEDIHSREQFIDFMVQASYWDTFRCVNHGFPSTSFICCYHRPGGATNALIFTVRNSRFLPFVSNALEEHAGNVRIADGKGYIIFEDDGETSNKLSATVSSSLTQYVYSLGISAGPVITGVTTLNRIWILIVLCTGLFCLATAEVMTQLSLFPIKLLRNNYALDDVIADNDFDALSKSIELLQGDIQSLSKCVSSVRSLFIDKLLSAEGDSEAVLKITADNYQFGRNTNIWQVIAAYSMFDSADALRARLEDEFPAGIKLLIRDRLSNGCTLILLAYSGACRLKPETLASLLAKANIERAGISCGCQRIDDLSIMLGQALEAYESGTSIHEYEPQKSEDAWNALIAHVTNGSAANIENALTQYENACRAGDTNVSLFRQNALICLNAARERLRREGVSPYMIQIDSLPEKLVGSVNEWHITFFETMQFFLKLIRHDEKTHAKTDIDAIIEYANRSYMNADFTIASMAEQFGLSVPALNNLFKASKGVTAAQYLSDMKLDIAKNLLTRTDMPVFEIGLKLGYYGQNSFIRRFKQLTNMTPGEYRDMFAEKR